MEKIFTLQPATDADRPAIMALLQEAGLPTQDLPDPLEPFFLGKKDGQLTGTVGLERLGDVALLRSLAVAAPWRGTGLGKQLSRAALTEARRLGMTSIYLITNTADRFFAKQGFQPIERMATPAEVQATAQFSGICPSSALVMRKTFAE